MAVGKAEQVEQAVKDEAAEFGRVRDAVLACLGAGPVAGDIDLTEESRFTRQVRFVVVEGDDVGRAVALQEPAVQFVYPPVGYEYDVDGGSVRLEVLREKSAEPPDVGAQAFIPRAVDAGLQGSEAQLVSR